jgi:replicative DNA helicase
MEARGSDITGLSTGFRDLDKKLAGLQPANLVVIAARPSMGKCLVGSTRVVDAKTGACHTLAELVASPELLALTHLASYDPVAGAFTVASPAAAQSNGVREVFEVRTATGRRIRATANHPLLTTGGWKQVDQLLVGEAVAAPARLPIFGVDRLPDAEVERLIREATSGQVDRVPAAVFQLSADQLARFLGGVLGVSPQAISEGKVSGRWWEPPSPGLTEEVQHLLMRFGLVASCREHPDGKPALVVHGTAPGNLLWDAVTAIEAVGEEETFDVEVPPHHNFVADDLVVHNSALTLNIATNAAQHGHPVAMFSLEMSKEEIVQRILCSVGRVDSMKLRTGQLGPLWQRVVDAASRMYRAPIFIDDSANVTVTDIRAKCRRLKRQHGLAMVVIDYLQLMQGSNRENRQQEISEISRSLKNLARELDVPILAVSQLNRSVELREDRRPRLSDLRESGSIEQDSDVVMFIYRHEYYHPEDVEKRGQAEVIIAKHRAGATGTVEMTFMPEFTRFADLGRD